MAFWNTLKNSVTWPMHIFDDPSKAAMPYLNQVPGTLQQYLSPYAEQGTRLMPGLEKTYGEMATDPNEIIRRLGAGYTTSPGYDFRKNQALTAINSASAAGGMAGTPMHQQEAGQLAENLAAEDYDKYLNHVLGIMGAGVQGQQGLQSQGFGASTNLAESLANLLESKAGLKFQGTQSRDKMIGDILGLIGGLGTKFAAGV